MRLRLSGSESCRCGTRREVPHRQQPVALACREPEGGGHDAVHVRDLGLQAATDEVVLEHARSQDQVLVSADTDFGTLLARSGARTPSVLLIRRLAGRRAAEQSAIIQANLGDVADDLDAGAVVVLGEEWIRIRRLPMPG